MQQMTVRTPDGLVDRAKQAAADSGRSLNEWVTTLIEAATNPDTASSEGQRLRERLRAAGLLQEWPGQPTAAPSEEEVARARAAFRGGRPVSDYIAADRE